MLSAHKSTRLRGRERPFSSGFEEALKYLPIREVKNSVYGMQGPMKQAKSLQEWKSMVEHESQRKRAAACIKAKPQASEQRKEDFVAGMFG